MSLNEVLAASTMAIACAGCVGKSEPPAAATPYTPASATRTTGPDGTLDWANVECVDAEAYCYDAAISFCKTGYEIVSKRERSAPGESGEARRTFLGTFGTRSGTTDVASLTGLGSRPAQRFAEEMLVHCKPQGVPAGPESTNGTRPPPSLRECVDDDVCRLGEHCRFAADAEKGLCVYAPQP